MAVAPGRARVVLWAGAGEQDLSSPADPGSHLMPDQGRSQWLSRPKRVLVAIWARAFGWGEVVGLAFLDIPTALESDLRASCVFQACVLCVKCPKWSQDEPHF